MAIMNISLRNAADAYRHRSQSPGHAREEHAGEEHAREEHARDAGGPESPAAVRTPRRPATKAPNVAPLAVVTPHPSDRWKTADEWKLLAECGPGDTELFFSKDPVEKRAALAICGDCPVVAECLAEAMTQERGVDLHGRYGIRGGTTPVQRRELARSWKDSG